LDYVDLHLDLTEGFHSWIHSHGLSTLEQARELMAINLSGLGGGTGIAGGDVDPAYYSAVDNVSWTSLLFWAFNQLNTWPSITEAEEKFLYTPHFYINIRDRAFESLLQEVNRVDHYEPLRRTEFFIWLHSVRRLYQMYTSFFNAFVEMRYPYLDYDLFNFVYTLPLEYRARYRLSRAVIQREIPALSLIPNANDNLLPTTNLFVREPHRILHRGKMSFNRMVKPVFQEKATLYADYENYLRHELRPWAEAILFDKCTLARGIFRPDALHSLMNRHLSGLEQWTIGKIAPIITYEMMLRRFCYSLSKHRTCCHVLH
jgi:asparagine synthase (glutamine-hydrolysing)